MEPVEISKAFNPREFESRIYDMWTRNGAFQPREKESVGDDTFVIVMPPPNVTGILHMGHGLNNTLQDILMRYHRMCGKRALWVPGSDHAGIATQNVVEKRLRKEGIDPRELGREKFVEETWKVKEEHHSVIARQLKEIGASCDWSRERFTLDEGLSRAVREVFVTFFERGLIYRGNYLVNWCPSCGTALSDDEVEHYELDGKLYHIRYPLVNGSGAVEIATTRPETLLGDTAVAVHPDDERYSSLVGQEVHLPLTGRRIPIVADSFVSMEFGTGAVKITPAHDPNDWEMGKRNGLEEINILNPDATLNNNVPEAYRSLSVKEARKRVIEDLKSGDFFLREEVHHHQVGHCYRCNTVIEPYLSDQWFVRMAPLAEKAMKALHDGDIRFYPKRWENTYTHWMNNIRDWCISRQLWWGHRIPVWYCGDCGEVMALREDPVACTSCGSSKISQEDDVLDTWFSSMLWPFSTLGWPEKTEDLESFYPTTTLVSAYDIIFFWVARMIMAGLEFTDQAPFRDILIHGLVRDKQGRKMSKSLGNGIDPLEVVHEYGADALKFTLAFLAAQGQDILLDKETFKLGSKFANKIWNAARYLLMNLEGRNFIPVGEITLDDADRWIFHRLNETVKNVREALDSYRFVDAAQGGYEFFWNDFCDWYIEMSKLKLYSGDSRVQDEAASLLMIVLEESLRLLHPFLSFITEEIYQKLPNKKGMAATASFPAVDSSRENEKIGSMFTSLQELVREVRTLRSEFTVPPSKKIRVDVKPDSGFFASVLFKDNSAIISDLIQASELTIDEALTPEEGSVPVAGHGFAAYVYIKEVIDVPREIEKREKEQTALQGQLKKVAGKLGNPQFLEKAPADIVEKEKAIREELENKLQKLEKHLQDLR